jgi:hypothetical protein
MKARLMMLMLGLLVAGVLVAGCGGDDKSSDAQATTQESTAKPAADAGADKAGSGSDVSKDPQIQQAVETCKQQVAANPAISDGLKADLGKVCETAASGDAQAAAAATKEVCLKIVDEVAPAGPARDQAKAACDQGSTGP